MMSFVASMRGAAIEVRTHGRGKSGVSNASRRASTTNGVSIVARSSRGKDGVKTRTEKSASGDKKGGKKKKSVALSAVVDSAESTKMSMGGPEPKPMISPRVANKGGSGTMEKNGVAEKTKTNGASTNGSSARRLTRPKYADEKTFTRRRKFPVLFYSKEMEPLAMKVAEESDNMVELGEIDWRSFPDGFPDLFINDAYDVRDRHVAFLASFHSPEVIFEQLSIIYSLPKMFVASFTLVLPFFPTGTAERVVREGEVATAVTLARILSNIPPSRGGPTSTIIFDIHALQERFYFGDSILPCFESGIPLLLERLEQLEDAKNVVIAYPDEGAYKRFHSFFAAAGYESVVCTKVREGTKRIVKLKEGEPIGRHVVIVDDLVQSGSTLIECQKLLARLGAAKVSAYATHGVFPNSSWKRFTSAGAGGQGFSHFWITDSCPQTVEALDGAEPFEILSLAATIAEALEV